MHYCLVLRSQHAVQTLAGAVGAAVSPPEGAGPYLERMGLDKPGDLKEAAVQKLIVAELHDAGYI